VLKAKADLLQMQAKFEQTKQERKRAENLLPTKAIADADYDVAVANAKVAEANVAVGEAAIRQSEAAKQLAKTSLDYTIIQSPVQGVIIARRVNVGQTVVASLNAPSLFLIAKDLRRMQVWASVNEADIGRIKPGLPVRFTVDAYPGEVFRGRVAQVRLNAAMTQNVVTYTVVVETDNSNLKLLPYLTANLQFEIDQRKGVLLVPNSALRWKPRPALVVTELRETVFSPSLRSGKPVKDREDRGRLWIRDGDFLRPIEVQIGATDGTQTEVSGSELSEGLEVVVGEIRKEIASSGDTTNPFAPKFFGGGQKKSF
jgi:HlyD family secretion protein